MAVVIRTNNYIETDRQTDGRTAVVAMIRGHDKASPTYCFIAIGGGGGGGMITSAEA